MVAAVSGPAGRLAGRIGFRPVLLLGFAVFAGGVAWYALRVGLVPDYVAVWLPGSIVIGLGIGLTFPLLSAAAVSSLRAERFAVGSAVNQTARQVGGAIGIALLVVILGAPATTSDALTSFRHLWAYIGVMALLAGLACTQLRATTTSDTPRSPLPAVEASRAMEEILDGEIAVMPATIERVTSRRPREDR